jgi:SAM-dependent methyltransferase
MMDILIRMQHGLGDAVQFTVVLKHLKKYRTDWTIDMLSLRGKHSAFQGLCRRSYHDQEQPPAGPYHHVFDLGWFENYNNYPDRPNSKVTNCLEDVFAVPYDATLAAYHVEPTEAQLTAAGEYLRGIGCREVGQGQFNAVLMHYEGNTSPEKKNISHEVAGSVCEATLEADFVPVILDWDHRSGLPDEKRIFCPNAGHSIWGGFGSGDAAIIAGLISRASLMVGVDSGPLHVAGATSTPTIGVWAKHHPSQFFDPCPNVLHFVPGDHVGYAPSRGLAYFTEHYRHQAYKCLSIDLPALVESVLTGKPFERAADERFHAKLTSTAYDAKYYHEHMTAGLDYLGHGDWQRDYGRWVVESLSFQGKKMLDVGCACGSILRGLGEAGAIVHGVDISEYMVNLGRRKWPDMIPIIHVCDAVNLHIYGNDTWDGVHSAQVAEHWKPELVPFILRELARVTKPNGVFFCNLDTLECMERQNRDMRKEDPTHVCIRPVAWWHETLEANGWRVATSEFASALTDHPNSFLRRYDWGWFVARRK